MLEQAGPESISFRAIAREAGVSQTAPYNHFTSKEHLLATLATIGFRELEASQAAATKGDGTVKEQIERLGRAYVRFACRHPQLYRLMFGVGMSSWRAHPEVATAKKASFGPLQEALAVYLATAGRNSAEVVETAAVIAWALAHGLSMLLIDGALEVPRNVDGAEMFSARMAAWLVAGLEAGAESIDASSATKRSAPLRRARRQK
jgi:AcrR family transcriptional regulator